MQTGSRRFPPSRLYPALLGLVVAALVAVGAAFSGEVKAGVAPSLWHRVPPGGGDGGYQSGSWDLSAAPLFLRKVRESLDSRGLFFDAADGLRIGARGSFEPGSGDLRVIVALRLDF